MHGQRVQCLEMAVSWKGSNSKPQDYENRMKHFPIQEEVTFDPSLVPSRILIPSTDRLQYPHGESWGRDYFDPGIILKSGISYPY